jgi:hypothetical protein
LIYIQKILQIRMTQLRNGIVWIIILNVLILNNLQAQTLTWGKSRTSVISILKSDINYSNLEEEKCSDYSSVLSGICSSVISAQHNDGFTECFIFDNNNFYFANIMFYKNGLMPDGKSFYQTLYDIFNGHPRNTKINNHKWVNTTQNALYDEIIELNYLDTNRKEIIIYLLTECIKK